MSTTTLGGLRNSLRAVLADTVQWRDTLLTQWIQDALRDYSLVLPFQDSTSLTTTAATRAYLLNSAVDENLIDVLNVEYPAGWDPRRFLARRAERHPAFLGGPYYDINKQNKTVSGEHMELKYLVLGETPSAGQTIWFEYLRPHSAPLDDSDLVTVPEWHLEALRLYVYWKATHQLELDESVALRRKQELLRVMGGSARWLYSLYRDRMFALASSRGGSHTARWRMDNQDRVY